MSAVRVAVFAFEGASLFHLSVPAMVLSALNGTPSLPRYEVRYFAQSPGRMRSDHGVVIEVSDGLQALRRADIVIVPAWHDPETAAPAEVTDALRKAHKQGKLIVGLCLGAFVLADAGLLDGKAATTHWAAREAFARRFPDVLFRPDVLYVDDGNVVTSAGTVAAIDCCLHLVRQRHGCEAANHMSRLLRRRRTGRAGRRSTSRGRCRSCRTTIGCRACWNGRATTLPRTCRSTRWPRWRR